MMLVANAPMFNAKQDSWINCGDPIPTPQPPYMFVPYPANSDRVLAVQADGSYHSVPLAQAGPPEYMQVAAPANGPGVLECQVGGAFVIQCVTGLQ